MNSNRLMCLKCTLLEDYKHSQQNLNISYHPTIALRNRSFVFLMVSQWICDTSPQRGFRIPEVSFHRLVQISKGANMEMCGQPPTVSLFSLLYTVLCFQVHTTCQLPFQTSLVFSMTLILFSMQGHFRKTTKVKSNKLLCKMNADSRQGLFVN